MEKINETKKYSVGSSTNEVGKDYWNKQYVEHTTGWDLGQVSPPLKAYVDQLGNKNLRILVPGGGNSYEAEYLSQQGFTDITIIDIAPALIERLQEKFANKKTIKIILGDFFQHQGAYDLILEQTFFCAVHPSLRKAYVAKMKALLVPDGKLVGVLFNKEFEQEGPPFGGSKEEYISLFKDDFNFKATLDPKQYSAEPETQNPTFETLLVCYNSFSKRAGAEFFINFVKR